MCNKSQLLTDEVDQMQNALVLVKIKRKVVIYLCLFRKAQMSRCQYAFV